MDYAELETKIDTLLYKKDVNGLTSQIMDAIDKHISARMLAVAEDFEAQASNYEQAAKESDNDRLGAWYSGRAASYTASARRMRNETTL